MPSPLAPTHANRSHHHDPTVRVQHHLEHLPIEILRHAQTFHDHVQYFIGPGRAGKEDIMKMPEGLRRLLSDVTDTERIEEGIREEIMQDDDARQVCF
jgi:potassium channel subfamily K